MTELESLVRLLTERVSLWRNAPSAASAASLLSVWGGLSRIHNEPAIEVTALLECLVHDDAQALLAADPLSVFDPGAWRRTVKQGRFDPLTHFLVAEDAALTNWAVAVLLNDPGRARPRFHVIDGLVRTYRILFVGAAADLAPVMREVNEDIMDDDEEKWFLLADTLCLRHRVIEEAEKHRSGE